MLKKIGKNLDKDQFLKITTAQLYSILYYASPVWLNRTLSASYWTKIRSLHYRILRGAIKDYKNKVTRPRLDKLCKRATPDMWSKYTTQTAVIKTVRDGSPSFLMTSLTLNLSLGFLPRTLSMNSRTGVAACERCSLNPVF